MYLMSKSNMYHNSNKNWVRVWSNSLVRGPLGVKKVFPVTNLEVFVMFLFSIFISGDSASYFLGLIMKTRLSGTLAQTRVE